MVKNLFLKIRNIIVGNWRNLTNYATDETNKIRFKFYILKYCNK